MNILTKGLTNFDFYRLLLDAFPAPVFVVSPDVEIVDYNAAAAATMLSIPPTMVLKRRAGEVLHCLHATETPDGCGRAPLCADCPIRNSVKAALAGQHIVRQKVPMEMIQNGVVKQTFFMVTSSPFSYDNENYVLVVLEDINELVAVKNLLPICSHCRKIRADDQYWHTLENYLKQHMDTNFSHGICPDCMQKNDLTTNTEATETVS